MGDLLTWIAFGELALLELRTGPQGAAQDLRPQLLIDACPDEQRRARSLVVWLPVTPPV